MHTQSHCTSVTLALLGHGPLCLLCEVAYGEQHTARPRGGLQAAASRNLRLPILLPQENECYQQTHDLEAEQSPAEPSDETAVLQTYLDQSPAKLHSYF